MYKFNLSAIRLGIASLALAGLAACGAPNDALQDGPVMRNIPAPAELDGLAAPEVLAPSFRVAEITVSVPRELKVSERNSYYPGGDIVWREDPIGDRHEQVKLIVANALAKGSETLEGTRAVKLDVVVTRFHALTEKARYTFGGVHAIQFDLTVLDAETGEVLRPKKRIRADFPALGGMAAIAAEQRGQTQKVRITDHLAMVIREELLTTDGYTAQPTGVFGVINQL